MWRYRAICKSWSVAAKSKPAGVDSFLDIHLYHHPSIEVIWVGVGLLEPYLAALEHILAQRHTVLRFAWVALQTSHEGLVLWRTLFLDDEHARGCLVVAWEPEWNGRYSIPLFSRRVLRFLAVENMYDLDYICC